MNCEEYRDLLVTDLGGEIGEDDRNRLQTHLDTCLECKETQLEFRAMRGMMKQLPDREWNETLTIRQLLRQRQRWRNIVFSKAALWLVTLTALIAVLSSLPMQWELSQNEFAVRWGDHSSRDAELARELKNLQVQLSNIQAQNQNFYRVSENRFREIVEQNNIQQQKRYWQTLEMFADYVQVQRKADLQKIQHDIATSYDRTGQEVERANELLEYVLRASATSEVPEHDPKP